MWSSCGNSPVSSLEYTSSPSSLSSKAPPPEGISVRPEICCLYASRSLVVKLTA